MSALSAGHPGKWVPAISCFIKQPHQAPANGPQATKRPLRDDDFKQAQQQRPSRAAHRAYISGADLRPPASRAAPCPLGRTPGLMGPAERQMHGAARHLGIPAVALGPRACRPTRLILELAISGISSPGARIASLAALATFVMAWDCSSPALRQSPRWQKARADAPSARRRQLHDTSSRHGSRPAASRTNPLDVWGHRWHEWLIAVRKAAR